jgi:HD-GYP domain-containing protein (c-di-GMP phosphodiesterase class II)
MNIAVQQQLEAPPPTHRKVKVADLRVGMYVSALDRPWLETPFLLQGFSISGYDDLEQLSQYCAYVYVDEKVSPNTGKPNPFTNSAPERRKPREMFPDRKLEVYTDTHGFSEEFKKAQIAVDDLSLCLDDIFSREEKGGSLDVVRIKQSVEPMIDSVSRNPDACIWLARMKQVDDYIYEHSLAASIWAVALGRQLGLPKSDLRTLATGGLLFDIGKLRVDDQLLNADRKLTDAEFAQVKRHVQYSVDSLKTGSVMNQDIIDMVAYHHERHNGKGYPYGLAGDDIPVFARIAAIVDCYDAMTSKRRYARAVSPAQAIKKLFEWKDVDFQGELVEAFIQAIGIYPAGTLVELSTGEVAVVVAEYRTRRLRPQVMVLLNSAKQPVEEVCILDLKNDPLTVEGEPLDIVNSLSPDDYGIDMSSIQL